MKRFKYSFLIVLLLIPHLVFGGAAINIPSPRLGLNTFGIAAGLKDSLQILVFNQNITTSTLFDKANQYDFVQGTADNQGVVTTGPPSYVTTTTNDFYPLQEIDSEQGALSYTTEGADSTFTDDGQVFTSYAGSGTATYRIVVHNDDATTTYGFFGAAVSATEIKIYQEASLTTSGWLGTAPAGKTPSTYEVYKVIGSDNFTGDQTHFLVLKPADGQPAGDQYIVGIYEYGANRRSFSLALNGAATAGKLTGIFTDNGAVYKGSQTDSAVYSDGAQSGFSSIAVTRAGAVIAYYYNGSAVAATDFIAPSAPTAATLFRSPAQLTLGCVYNNGTPALFFNGAIGLYTGFSAALTATQILNLHNSDAVQALINP